MVHILLTSNYEPRTRVAQTAQYDNHEEKCMFRWRLPGNKIKTVIS